jgi:hypothetical protein
MIDTHILVSPLGRSPGAVSGLYYSLRTRGDKPVHVTQVVTVGTTDPWVRMAARTLQELFDYEKRQGHVVVYRAEYITAGDLRGGERDIGPFVARLGRRIQQAREAEYTVHVGVTGGRSGMGALAALAAQLYGASHLYHLWVDEEIERKGQMGEGSSRMEARPSNPLLKPPADQYELVELPFLDLSPLHPVIRRYLKSGELPDVDSPLYGLFTTRGARHLRQVFPAPLTIAQADRLVELATAWSRTEQKLAVAQPLRQSDPAAYLAHKRAVDQTRDDILIELMGILQDAEIADAPTAKRALELIRSGADWTGLVALARDAQDGTGFWQWLGENKDQVGAVVGIGGLLLKMLELWLKTQGNV